MGFLVGFEPTRLFSNLTPPASASRKFPDFSPEIFGPTNWPLSLSEDRQLIAKKFLSVSGKSERVPKPRKSKDFGTKSCRAGGDAAVKTAPADDFPTLFKPTTLISAKMEPNHKELPKLFDQTKFLEQKHIKNYQFLRVCDCNICSLIFFITP